MGNNSFSLEEETRCEFLVSEKRKKIWKTQMDMALEVKRICEKHHIKYFIIWGTLLGAVRHKGYIPWDDDFDIAFFRRDYNKFCKVARREIKEPLFLQDALSDPAYFTGYTRIRDSRTTGWIMRNPSPKYHNGIFIDLYPLDVIPENKYVWQMQAFAIKTVLKGLITPDNKARKKGNTAYRALVYLHRLCCVMFDWMPNPKKVGTLYYPSEVEAGYWFYAKDAEKTLQIPFENTSFSAPAGYEGILRNVYGNYKKFPPIGKRGTWHERQIVFDPDIPYLQFYKRKKRGKSNR